MDYKREKEEIAADLDRLELAHMQELRAMRGVTSETESLLRRKEAEVEGLEASIAKDSRAAAAKKEELRIEEKRLLQAHESFR